MQGVFYHLAEPGKHLLLKFRDEAELSAKIDTLSAEKKSMQANLEELDSLASI